MELLFPGVNFLLSLVDSVVDENDADLSRLLAQTRPASPASIHAELKTVLHAQATAFESGHLSIERLLEVVFSPFLRLAAKENLQGETAADAKLQLDGLKFLDLMTSAWFEAVEDTLAGKLERRVAREGEGIVSLIRGSDYNKPQFLLGPEKEAEIKHALNNICFVQVRRRQPLFVLDFVISTGILKSYVLFYRSKGSRIPQNDKKD